MLDLSTYCPSTRVYDGLTNEDAGWIYAIHIRPEGDTRTECQTCGLKFSVPPSAASHADNLKSNQGEKNG